MLYLSSNVCSSAPNPWFSTTEYKNKSLAINVEMYFVICFTFSEEGESFVMTGLIVLWLVQAVVAPMTAGIFPGISGSVQPNPGFGEVNGC